MSRRSSDAEEQDSPAPTAFRYPPKSGKDVLSEIEQYY